jgi:hypothetical protein
MRRCRVLSTAVLLAVAFLVHDLLMAGGAHAVTAAHRGVAADTVRAGSYVHVAGCSAVRSMVPVRAGTDGDGRAAAAAVPPPPLDASIAAASLPASDPRGGPPGVRRALLQIWRI